ncbi:MAG: hypothetical protein E7459_04480 [Ruminococcaceae bacterium]|nr:hypothetical protein [Oscillospiraceae bacterium]
MRRRILSMFLAILLVVAMSLPVFAHAYTEYIDYAGEMVEANARCGGDSYSVSTNTMATGFLVQSMAQVYLAPTVSMPDGSYYYVWGNETRISSRIVSDGVIALECIVGYHYAGGSEIYSAVVYPSE